MGKFLNSPTGRVIRWVAYIPSIPILLFVIQWLIFVLLFQIVWGSFEFAFCGLPYISELFFGIVGGALSGAATVYCSACVAPSNRQGAAIVAAVLVSVLLGSMTLFIFMGAYLVEESELLSDFSDWLLLLISLSTIVGAVGFTITDDFMSELADKS